MADIKLKLDVERSLRLPSSPKNVAKADDLTRFHVFILNKTSLSFKATFDLIRMADLAKQRT
ncbi:hypothetical protein H5410_011088 [Solanum commersonii]|uniref:Uncharacterized protein n=1 Tax=Solanum commersonii TaxID=4109 RepID=A0A9J6AMN6_SOLCO|nr:hypothetical protein H5410_011088 [Solanum commersonii]